MNYKWIAAVVLSFCPIVALLAQKDQGYQTLRMTSAYTSFPDTGRAKGCLDGDSVFRPVAGHYDDSSVLLVIPPGLKRDRKVDLIFWFHGWHNNIDTALQFYGLARQFAAANCDAVLVLPEAARDAADSYGGKLKRKGDFVGLVKDVADILENGEMLVDEVFLFDALYGRLAVFLDWIKENKRHHFVHWYTDHGGGTDMMSDTLMVQLQAQHIDYVLTGEALLNAAQVRGNKILFVHSTREHNVIINDPDDFRLLLENSSVILTKR